MGMACHSGVSKRQHGRSGSDSEGQRRSALRPLYPRIAVEPVALPNSSGSCHELPWPTQPAYCRVPLIRYAFHAAGAFDGFSHRVAPVATTAGALLTFGSAGHHTPPSSILCSLSFIS